MLFGAYSVSAKT